MASPETDIFAQYSALNARQTVELMRPLFESYARPVTGVQQRLFDIDQAAAYLGRTSHAVRLLIHRGKLPVTKIDSKVQVNRAALDKLIEDCTFFETADHRT
jgi:excisionase family DNA binding protein